MFGVCSHGGVLGVNSWGNDIGTKGGGAADTGPGLELGIVPVMSVLGEALLVVWQGHR